MDTINKEEKLVSDKRLTKGWLENGLTYYIYNNDYPKGIIRLALAIKAGSLIEENGQRGIAHFTEHMCLIKNHNDKRNNQIYFNNSLPEGYTNFEETVFMLNCTIENIDEGMNLFKDIISGTVIQEDNVEQVRWDVINELNSLKSKLAFKIRQSTLPLVMNDTEFGHRLPIGELKDVEKITFDSIIDFHKKWYMPSNSALFVIGDIESFDVGELIQRYFSSVKNEKSYKEMNIINKFPNTNRFVINTFEDFSGFEVQLYYLKVPSKCELVSDLEKKAKEFFLLNIIQQHLLRMSAIKGITFSEINCNSEKLIKDFEFNIIEFKGDAEFLKKINFIFTTLKEFISYGILESEYKEYKRNFLEEFRYSYITNQDSSTDLITKECINEFLYNESLISINYEYDICSLVFESVKFEEINESIKQQFRDSQLALVINVAKQLDIDKESLSSLLNMYVIN